MSDPENESLRSTFPSYMAEGERLYLCGEFTKAAQSFSNALHLQNGDKNCLVARSKCFLKMGDLEKSLKDAEASLQGDPTFCKGILQKAETLYTMGDFEFALVFYHRGYKLRPDREFKVGIQKAQEAINNSVGSPSSIKLENRGDLSFLSKQAENMKAQQKPHPMRQFLHDTKRESKRKGSLKSEKTVRQLLGELYVDKEYLEKLLLDEDLIKGTIKRGLTVEDLIMTGINYLDTLPSRKVPINSFPATGHEGPVCHSLAQALSLQMDSAGQGPSLPSFLFPWCQEQPISSEQFILLLPRSDLPDAKSRALDNIGRVFARVGKFQQAIDTWEEKIPLAKTTLEKTWLFHEIGRCYLELEQPWQAQSYGEKSQQYAEEEGDVEWQLNASVLVAQAQVKLKDFESAVSNFEKALERAKIVHNNDAQQAIISALDDANKGIIEELKKTNYRENLKEKREKEETMALDDATMMAKRLNEEKKMKRAKEEPEKVMKQWEREHMEPDDELFEADLKSSALELEGSRQRLETENTSSSGRTELGAMEGRDSGEVGKRLPGELGRRESGETGRKLSEVGRRQATEIYRRPSGEIGHRLSEGLSGSESEGSKRAEADRRESEDLPVPGEMGNTENPEEMKKDVKEDE
nr:tetratricopeptide repeat protein 25 [Loxodonta africana]